MTTDEAQQAVDRFNDQFKGGGGRRLVRALGVELNEERG